MASYTYLCRNAHADLSSRTRGLKFRLRLIYTHTLSMPAAMDLAILHICTFYSLSHNVISSKISFFVTKCNYFFQWLITVRMHHVLMVVVVRCWEIPTHVIVNLGSQVSIARYQKIR